MTDSTLKRTTKKQLAEALERRLHELYRVKAERDELRGRCGVFHDKLNDICTQIGGWGEDILSFDGAAAVRDLKDCHARQERIIRDQEVAVAELRSLLLEAIERR